MTKFTGKKISRRDAIKLFGAATGATLLANLPSKWRTPELASGVLPAHAQTSSLLLTITDGGFTSFDVKDSHQNDSLHQIDFSRGVVSTFIGEHFVQISDNIPNIPLILVTNASTPITWNNPTSAPDGEYLTDTDGIVKMKIALQCATDVDFIWKFKNPSDGIDMKTFTLLGPGNLNNG